MRFATLEYNFWQLRSAEEANLAHPETFKIPPLALRTNLEVGEAAKLIFDIEGEEEDGSISVQGERMWVIVSQVGDGWYVGILDNEVGLLEPGDEVYLCVGAEIPFGPEHVIDIDKPPAQYVFDRLSREPTRRWPRE